MERLIFHISRQSWLNPPFTGWKIVTEKSTIVTEMVTPSAMDAGHILFGATRRAVLGLLLGRPDERFHMRQVARLTDTGLGPVQRELAVLTGAGIIRREQSGRQVYFQAERASPIFAELQTLIQKTTGTAGILRESMQSLKSHILVAVVFGSVARGQMQQSSDVDLLVLSDDLSVRDLAGAIRQASMRLGRDVNLNLYKSSEWITRAHANHALVRAILEQPRLQVIGDPHELERLAEKRVAKASSSETGGNPKTVRRNRSRSARQR